MKVIFVQDVLNVARAGEIKEVADGYGRNFLIPRKLALLASPSAVGTVEIQRKIRAKKQEQLEGGLVELANQLDGKEIILQARVGAKDRLYGSITNADIATELEGIAGLAIDKKKIELAEPIRQLGSYEVAIRLGKDIVPKIRVSVTEEETPKEEEKPLKKEEKAPKEKEKAPKKEEKAPKKEKKTQKKKRETPTKEKKTEKEKGKS